MIHVYSSQIKQPKPRVPGPRGWPLVGVLPQLLEHDTLTVLEEMRRHSHGDLFKLRVGPGSLVIASHPEHARHILQTNNRNYTKGQGLRPRSPLDDRRRSHRQHGRALAAAAAHDATPLSHRQQLAGITTLMTDAIGEALDKLGRRSQRERRVPTARPGDGATFDQGHHPHALR